MKIVFIILSLQFLASCQTSGGGETGAGIIAGHQNVPKTFTLTTPLNRNYTTGETIVFSLEFPLAVTVTGSPRLPVTIGVTSGEAVFASVSGKVLLFNYTVGAGDLDTDGIGVGTTLNLNGGSILYNTVENAGTAISVPMLTSVLVNAPVDTAPVANNLTPAAFDEDTESVITLSYSDVDGDLATSCTLLGVNGVIVSTACACSSGTCTVGVTGNPNHSGSASFTYRVTANGKNSNSASATLTINPVPDPPVTTALSPGSFNEDTQSVITLPYTDAESDQASSCALSGLTNVVVTQACACTAGVCTVGVTGTPNYNGGASFGFTVTANAQTSNSSTATLTISPIDDAPVTSSITPAAFNEDTQELITLVYSDAESHQASLCAVANLTNVTVTQACACASGVCTVGVTGAPHYYGAGSFTYTVTANTLTSNQATATLSILSVEDPASLGAIGSQATDPGVNTTPIAFTFTDPDGAVCSSARLSMTSSDTTIVSSGVVTWGGTAPNCTATITPLTKAGSTTITITASDGGLPNKTTSFVLTVNGAILSWEYPLNTAITTYDFGTPGANTSVILKLKNIGNAASDNVVITDNAGDPYLSQMNSCTTLAPGATCDVTVDWDNAGGTGFRQEIYSASITGSSADVTVSGTK